MQPSVAEQRALVNRSVTDFINYVASSGFANIRDSKTVERELGSASFNPREARFLKIVVTVFISTVSLHLPWPVGSVTSCATISNETSCATG